MKWWKGACQTSSLSKIAVAILQLPCTSAATERSFSTYGWIHNSKRNRLTADRAGKITYISHNLKLLDKEKVIKPEEKEEEESDNESVVLEDDEFVRITEYDFITDEEPENVEDSQANHVNDNETDTELVLESEEVNSNVQEVSSHAENVDNLILYVVGENNQYIPVTLTK